MDPTRFIFLAIFIESIVETVSWAAEKKPDDQGEMKHGLNWQRVTAAGLGVGLAVLAGLDIFSVVGVDLSVPYAGSVLTGIPLARGATYVHDLWKRVAPQS